MRSGHFHLDVFSGSSTPPLAIHCSNVKELANGIKLELGLGRQEQALVQGSGVAMGWAGWAKSRGSRVQSPPSSMPKLFLKIIVPLQILGCELQTKALGPLGEL